MAIHPTNKIEQEIEEAEDINSKITEMCAETDERSQKEPKKKITGETHDETVVHIISNEDKLINDVSCDNRKHTINRVHPWFLQTQVKAW